MGSNSASTTAPEHFNSTGCHIQCTEGKGRGVYASRYIPRKTIVEISPVLFFTKQEYEEHGKHTVLDHYTFNWKDGRMALALGLGSLFNHSNTPNVSFTLDPQTDSIKYETVREIDPGEELCIFYGHKLWFDPVDVCSVQDGSDPEIDDGWGGLSVVNEEHRESTIENEALLALMDGDENEIIDEESLPFTRYKPPPDEEELDTIRTMLAWVVDVPDPRHITALLKWLKQAGLDNPDLGHLKRIRKQDGKTTLLLSTFPTAPTLPEGIDLPDPIQVPVPTSAALTLTSLSLKTTFWPTFYAPRRKGESEEWSRGKLRWAVEAMKAVASECKRAKAVGELPIAAYVPPPYGAEDGKRAIAHDTRVSAGHPLRHAVLNLVRTIAAADSQEKQDDDTVQSMEGGIDAPRNGSNYLLTSLTVFLSHEPCIMCSMALLHSRVKEVIYLHPMKTGGCGGSACLPTLQGI
ncbi:tRNA-specific adenosine deaminase subunit tad3 [Stygiomarasmius scandens]|uniref:tRNA-specific adenosine deaminase subunit tad3 n=1 Tax=Marasmiellus scandens TaxID=2682957 RepID=A0ABR1K3D8_9AGAR